MLTKVPFCRADINYSFSFSKFSGWKMAIAIGNSQRISLEIVRFVQPNGNQIYFSILKEVNSQI